MRRMQLFKNQEGTTPSSPMLFCAPMAGVTHSAFRRLLSDFGGYGAIYTELLASRQMVHEDAGKSPYLKRRAEEGRVIYQLLLTGQDAIPEILSCILPLNPAAIDINCGCGGRYVRQAGGGVALFENRQKLEKVIKDMRREYAGTLMLKIRLGRDVPGWREPFLERIRIIEDGGADAITLHPRFAGQHMKRGARHELFSWLADNTRLPVIANGDILGPATIARKPEHFEKMAGIMVGRMAIIRPWLFAAWHNPGLKVDHLKTWLTFYDYLLEDFGEKHALGPLKLFTKYYAQNFAFGHTLYTATRTASTVQALREHAIRFMSVQPAMVEPPTLPVIY
jgi:tRNA-dihydrouridine synthase